MQEDKTAEKKARQAAEQDSIPKKLWTVYEKAFFSFSAEENRRFTRSTEKQLGQLERRIARKKKQENHQVLADMKDLHRKVAQIGYTVVLKDIRWMKKYRRVVRLLARLDISFLKKMASGAVPEDIAGMEKTVQLLRTKSLYEIYKDEYMQYLVGQRIEELMEAEPEKQYPEARGMKRHFILHIGPTNSGKTFRSLERLKLARCGVYLGPLRLLALEVYEQMNKYEVPCTMRTGQECIEEADSRVVASTIEMADFDENYDIAVIDEAQMVTDPDRGHSWTKAILGIRAGEIHICMSPAAEQAIIHLIELCRDDYEIERYERKTALICEDEPFVFPDDVRKGDALIVFSKKSVLDVAGRLEEQKINASVIYGSLPPEIRRRQMHLFNSGRTKVVVATDAIGMGLNLPVRRIIFLQAEKYDGVSRRPLLVSEIKQIAGRAGRFGIYDSGYVNAMGREELQYIRERYEAEEDPVSQVHLGFPQILLDIEAPMDELLKIWHDVTPTEPFVKENIDEALYLYEQAKRCKEMIDGFENKHVLYRMITCPIDIKDRFVVSLWLQYCRTYTADVSLEKPVFHRDRSRGIMQYETYYKQLDLYYQFSHRMQKVIDEEWLESEREKTEMAIMRYLTKGKYKYIARCKYCGKLLQLGSPFQVCDHCYHRDGRREHFRQKERMEKG